MPHLISARFSLSLLLLLAAFASIGRPARFSSAERSLQAKIQPEVRAALAGGPATTRVLVELRKPPSLAAGRPDIARARVQVAAEQTLVLAGVAPADVQVIYRYQALPALAVRVNERGLAALAARPEVTQITLDGVGTAADAQSLPLIHADEVQAAGITGAGSTVAVLDTGIDTNNIDLEDDIAYEKCFLSYGGCPTGLHPAEDNNGHGTNVAGIITSDGMVAPIGVAPAAKIAAYKILDASGSGAFSDWAAALDDIIANHPEVNIVNMSLESTDPCPAGTVGDAITTLRGMGVATFIASGNGGSKNSLFIPACIPDGISVGATYDANIGSNSGWETHCTDQTTRADQVACWSNSDDTLDLLAPGAIITSTGMGGGLSSYRGTSQAAPHAAGVAALLLEAVPGLSVDEIENRMKLTGTMITDDLHDNNPNTNRHTPRIDARVALLTGPTATATQPASTVTPTVTPAVTLTVTPTVTPAVTLTVTPTVTPTITQLPPTSTATPSPTATPTPHGAAGDASCDGVVNAVDAALVLQATAGLIERLPCPGGDANGDGRVDAIDAALILQYVAGLIPILPPL